MRRLLSVVALGGALCLGSAGYSLAQDSPATPVQGGGSLCATPQSTPDAPGTPEIITTGSPEAIATSVAANVDTAIQSTVCGTPGSTPTT